MWHHKQLTDQELGTLLRNGSIGWGGNQKLKIYGSLGCSSGKRMKRENRVFFCSEQEAKQLGYRPCGHCLGDDYKIWKDGSL